MNHFLSAKLALEPGSLVVLQGIPPFFMVSLVTQLNPRLALEFQPKINRDLSPRNAYYIVTP